MADQDRDQDRIKIDTTAAWDRIRTSYTAAAHASLEAKLAGRSDDEKARLRGVFEKVPFPYYHSLRYTEC